MERSIRMKPLQFRSDLCISRCMHGDANTIIDINTRTFLKEIMRVAVIKKKMMNSHLYN